MQNRELVGKIRQDIWVLQDTSAGHKYDIFLYIIHHVNHSITRSFPWNTVCTQELSNSSRRNFQIDQFTLANMFSYKKDFFSLFVPYYLPISRWFWCEFKVHSVWQHIIGSFTFNRMFLSSRGLAYEIHEFKSIFEAIVFLKDFNFLVYFLF